MGRGFALLPLAVDFVLLASVCLAPLSSPGMSVGPNSPSTGAFLLSANASGAIVTLDPPAYWMRTGANLTLEAAWSAGTPSCNVTPLWYRWSVDEGSATGFLNDTAGPSVTFTADSFGTGAAKVAVQSGAVFDCGSEETVLESARTANISIVVALSLSVIEIAPLPLLPGAPATLTGRIDGGEPPYTIGVSWGDGNHSLVAVPSDGAFSIGHRFLAGEFVPYVVVEDSAGDLVNASAPESVLVGVGLEVGILPTSYVAEVGVPVQFTGIAVGQSAGDVPLYDCSSGTATAKALVSAAPNDTAFACTFSSLGTAEVLFGEFPSRPGEPSASVVLYETVVAPPSVSTRSVEAVGEVGGIALVRVHLSGGALPGSLTWNFSGSRSGEEKIIEADGEGVVTLPLAAAGDFPIGFWWDDSLGVLGTNATSSVRVDPSLNATATGGSTIVSNHALLGVSGYVFSGCPPFSWWSIPSSAASNSTIEYGSRGDIGRFSWSGEFAREGNLSVAVGVSDGCGVTWQSTLVLSLVPAPAAEFAAAPGPTRPNETLSINASVRGGAAPFRLEVHASDNESWNRTLPAEGTYQFLFLTDGNGTLELVLSLSDSLGAVVAENLSVFLVRPPDPTIPPPGPEPPPSTVPGPSGNATATSVYDPTWLLAVVLVAGCAGTAFWMLRRDRGRKERRDVPGPDPVATLKQIIEPADGAERFTVELMAEEAGVPLADVRATIDRLVTEGRVHSESGADGEEVLSWSHESGR